jgi:molybdopterin converting factor small subunit
MDDQAAMTVTLKLFAVLRDRAGVGEVALELPEGATVAVAVDAFLRRYPGLGPYASRIACAVNLARVGRDAVLSEGDELALLPPVSGG